MPEAATRPQRVEPYRPWPALLGKREAADYLGLSTRAIETLVSAGQLPRPIHPPGLRRSLWRRTELDDAIATWKSTN